MRDHKRLIALLLCLGLLLVLAVSSAFIVLEAGHVCCGKTCEICESVAKTEALLRGVAAFAFLLHIAAILPAMSRADTALKAARWSAPGTLVCWKVRLNN